MQSNIQQGDKVFVSSVDLTGLEDYLVELHNDSGTPKLRRPAANDAQALYLLLEGGDALGDNCEVRPLEPGKNARIKMEGTGNPGDMVVLADVATPADAGMIRVLPSDPGTYRVIGWLEEVAVDGQLALVRLLGQGNTTVL